MAWRDILGKLKFLIFGILIVGVVIFYLKSTSKEKPKGKEGGELIYRNENYNLEIRYPKEWGKLTLKEVKTDLNESKIYIFSASGNFEGKEILEIYYHEPSKNFAIISKGTHLKSKLPCSPLPEHQEWFQHVLSVYKNGKTTLIYASPPEYIEVCETVTHINFSPNGKYIYFLRVLWESGLSEIFNIETHNWITNRMNEKFFFSPYENVYWSKDNKVVALAHISPVYGEAKIFVSDYDNPDNLNKIFDLQEIKELRELAQKAQFEITPIQFLKDNKQLTFSVKIFSLADEKETILFSKNYLYLIETKELKELP